MAKYIKGIDRGQLVLFDNCIDDMISSDNPVRVIDFFVECLDLKRMGFEKAEPNSIGTDHYDPRDLLKLYIYGYKNGIRSSRKLEQLCSVNIEVMWLLRKIKPNFRTISDFRKEHANKLKEIFKEVVIMCGELNLLSGIYSQDGVKIEAVNSKDKNFTLNKVDDHIKRIEKSVEEYLEKLEEMDKQEEKQNIENMVTKEELEERLKKKEELIKKIQEKEVKKKTISKYKKN